MKIIFELITDVSIDCSLKVVNYVPGRKEALYSHEIRSYLVNKTVRNDQSLFILLFNRLNR